MRGIVLVAAAALIAGMAHARERTSLHPIEWYVQHPAERQATLKLCRSDHQYSHNVDCANAQSADTSAWSDDLDHQLAARTAYLHDPHYWASNRLARIGTLAACRNPSTIYTAEDCAAARAGDALDTKGRN